MCRPQSEISELASLSPNAFRVVCVRILDSMLRGIKMHAAENESAGVVQNVLLIALLKSSFKFTAKALNTK